MKEDQLFSVIVNARDNDGRTALYLAAGGGHLDVAQFLVESGVKAFGGNPFKSPSLRPGPQDAPTTAAASQPHRGPAPE